MGLYWSDCKKDTEAEMGLCTWGGGEMKTRECVCVCVGGYSLKVESANESCLPSTSSCYATSPLHHAPRAPLIYRTIIFSPQYRNLGSLPLEELTEGRWRQMKRRTVLLQHKHKPDEE